MLATAAKGFLELKRFWREGWEWECPEKGGKLSGSKANAGAGGAKSRSCSGKSGSGRVSR